MNLSTKINGLQTYLSHQKRHLGGNGCWGCFNTVTKDYMRTSTCGQALCLLTQELMGETTGHINAWGDPRRQPLPKTRRLFCKSILSKNATALRRLSVCCPFGWHLQPISIGEKHFSLLYRYSLPQLALRSSRA